MGFNMKKNAQKIEELYQAIMNDEMNTVYTKRGERPVYAANPKAKIVIIGQAPGRIAQEKHVPWDDRSGDRLRHWLGVFREEFYNPRLFSFLPMDFYFPGSGKSGDLPPRKGFAEKWHGPLLELMPDIQLKIIIGQYAQAYYLVDKPGSVTETVRSYKQYIKDGLLPLPHPSPRNQIWEKKNPWFAKYVIPLLQSMVSRTISNKSK